jgi:subtilisin family serine protease
MKKLFLWLLLSGIVLAILMVGCSKQPQKITGPQVQQAPLFNQTPGAQYIPGSYIVVMKESVADVDKDVDEMGLRYSIKADFRYKHALKGFAGKLSPAAVQALRNDPRVAYIEQDQMAHIFATQLNPTWGLDRIDQRALPLDNSYTYNQTGAGVDVYCIDTGIRFTHVDFGGRAVTGYDAITPGGTAADGNGHGTHTAGTIGGATYGVAKGVHLIAVRVLNNSGSGTYSQVISGIDWVTANHTTTPAVANMSLGGPQDAALDQAVRNSIADGVTYCVAAGNDASNASGYSPADVVEALTVGATDNTDAWAYFSNYGSVVDILAPGVNVTSDYYTSNTATAIMSGTSMSSPHVAGAAALYLEANPTAAPAAVHSAITSNATTNAITGVPSGTVNKLLYSLIGAPPPPPSAPTLSSPADGATGVSIPATLTWNASTGATSYRVQVSTSSSFTTLAYDQSGITSTSTSVPGLASNTLYYWRVNATNAGGTSAWSTVWSFTTTNAPPPPPAAPTLISPANGANNVSRTATLTWNASTGATSYRVQVSTSSSFTTLVYDQSGITSTSTIVSGLGSRIRYYWHVNATNAGGTSAWSAVWRFRTAR